MAVRTDGNWEGWLKFFLRGVAEVSQAATDTARAILQLRETGRMRVFDGVGKSALGQRLFDFLFERPILNIRMAGEHLDCSFAKANQLVEQFAQIGLLEEMTGWQRNRRFRFKPYLQLFEEPPAPGPPQTPTTPPENRRS